MKRLVKNMNKRKQENFRTDELTTQLLLALQLSTDRKKSDLIRSAIYAFAKSELPEEIFNETVVASQDLKELYK